MVDEGPAPEGAARRRWRVLEVSFGTGLNLRHYARTAEMYRGRATVGPVERRGSHISGPRGIELLASPAVYAVICRHGRHHRAPLHTDEIAYWAPAESRNTEVDFLLRRGKRFIAIEVKATRRWRADLAKGLRAIADLKGVERRIVVYMGNQVLRPEPGIEVLPHAKFMAEVQSGL